MAPQIPVTHPQAPGAERAAQLGLLLALALSLPTAIAAAGFALGIPLTPWPLLVAALAIAGWCWKQADATALQSFGVASAVVLVAAAIGALWFDLSYDGQTYHQVGIRQLAEGWNPVWDPTRSESLVGGPHVTGLPKGAWLLPAMLLQATGNIEVGKAMQLLALVSATLLTGSALLTLGVARRRAWFVTVAAALNPVTTPQLMTYYVDGLVASSLLIIAALGTLWYRTRQSRWGVALVLHAALLCTLKFTGAALVAQCGILALAWLAWRDRARFPSALRLGVAAGVFALLAGINPYITNTVWYGHPAYPARGRDALPIAGWVHRDSAFSVRPRLEQVLTSMFAVSSDDSYRPPQLKLPFTVHANEVAAFTTLDTRIGGWGPLFGAALLVGLLAFVVAWRRAEPVGGLALIALVIGASSLALPFGFYARYAPQLWLAVLPPLLLIRPRLIVMVLAALVATNIAIVALASNVTGSLDQVLHRRQLAALAVDAAGGVITVSQEGAPFVNVDLHFTAYGIRYVTQDTPACPHPAVLLRTHAVLCLPDARSPQPTPDPLDLVKPWIPSWITLSTGGAR